MDIELHVEELAFSIRDGEQIWRLVLFLARTFVGSGHRRRRNHNSWLQLPYGRRKHIWRIAEKFFRNFSGMGWGCACVDSLISHSL